MQTVPTQRPGDPPWKQIALFLFTLAVLLLCGMVLRPFLSALLGAVVLAVVTERPFNRVVLHLRSRSLSAVLMLLLVVLSVITPAFFIAKHLSRQAVQVVKSLRSDTTQLKIAAYLDRHSTVADAVQSLTDGVDLQHTAQTTAAYVGGKLAMLLGHSIEMITQLVIMLFLLFFLYRDHDQAIAFARSLLPLDAKENDELLEKIRGTIFATALGRLVIAGIQGILAGAGFWTLGVPSFLFWAVLTVFCAMIPAFGSLLVWGPIAIYLGLTGHWGKAALLALWGGVIVSTIDNILYPILVGSQLRQHTVTILLSILGGVAFFGLAGLVLGPVLFATAGTLLQFWRLRSTLAGTAISSTT